MSDTPRQNTDIELWREVPSDYYSPSIHVTENKNIGIDVGGLVIVQSVRNWHRLATNGGWINARISPPAESGRYWCVVSEQNDLGLSHYQWNCAYNLEEKRWSDKTKGVNVVYYMPLPNMPHLL